MSNEVISITSGRWDKGYLAPLGFDLFEVPANKVDFISNYKTIAKDIADTGAAKAVILGDRYEYLLAAIICKRLGMRIYHIHAGERTHEFVDDNYRHAISSISDVCMCVHPKYVEYCKKIAPDASVFLVDSPSLDTIYKNDGDVQARPKYKFFLLAYNPVGIEKFDIKYPMLAMKYTVTTPYRLFVVRPNGDVGSDAVNDVVDTYATTFPTRIKVLDELTHTEYLSFLKYAQYAFGNSSSLVIESPSYRTPVLLMGNRQNGRYLHENITLFDGKFPSKNFLRNNFGLYPSEFGNGNAVEKICKIVVEN